jgi:hypothetical protein
MSSAIRSALAAPWLLLSCLALCPTARAAEPLTPPRASAARAADTSTFVRRFHLYASAGSGWIASPAESRDHTDAGQEFQAGVQALPRRALRFNLGLDYMVLPMHRVVKGVLIEGVDADGNPFGEPIETEQAQTGTAVGLRGELRWRALPNFWLLAGGGMNHISTRDPNSLQVGAVYNGVYNVPFLVTSSAAPDLYGWAWSRTLGVRRDFDFLGPVLGLEFRWSTLALGTEQVQTGSVQLGWGGGR